MSTIDAVRHLATTTNLAPVRYGDRIFLLHPAWILAVPEGVLDVDALPPTPEVEANLIALFQVAPPWPFKTEIDQDSEFFSEGGEAAFYQQIEEEGDYGLVIDGVPFSAQYLYELGRIPGSRVTVMEAGAGGERVPLWFGAPVDMDRPATKAEDMILGRLLPRAPGDDDVPW